MEDIWVRTHLWVGGHERAGDWPGRVHRPLYAAWRPHGEWGMSPTASGFPWKDYRDATDLTVEMADRPGQLAPVGEARGSRRAVNIEGACVLGCGGPTADIHVLVDSPETACRALDAAGIACEGREARDRPGGGGSTGPSSARSAGGWGRRGSTSSCCTWPRRLGS